MRLYKIANGIRADLERKHKPHKDHAPYLSTGSSLLNLAISDRVDGGFKTGHYYFIVGDSASGKTFISMTCFAEACRSDNFKNHRLLYDNVEDGMLMDVRQFFGESAEKRIESPPSGMSETVEEFYYALDDLNKAGAPYIYILDSMDALTSDQEGDKFEEQKTAHRAGKDVPGSYGDGKAKKNSEGIRKALSGIRKTGSILIILCQTRDNLGFGFEKKTRSGGRALRFYATCELWSSIQEVLTKTVRGKVRKVGITALLQTKKNRITGKLAEVPVDIYPSFGIDDVGSCVDWLVSEKWWAKTKADIKVGDDGHHSRESLIQLCERRPKMLSTALQRCWDQIQKDSALKRTRRYD